MAVYLQCFRTPDGEKAMYEHARQYLGYADREGCTPVESVRARLREHLSGRGSALTAAAIEAGLVLPI